MASNGMTQEEAFTWANLRGYFPPFPLWEGHIGGWGAVSNYALAIFHRQKREWEAQRKAKGQ